MLPPPLPTGLVPQKEEVCNPHPAATAYCAEGLRPRGMKSEYALLRLVWPVTVAGEYQPRVPDLIASVSDGSVRRVCVCVCLHVNWLVFM